MQHEYRQGIGAGWGTILVIRYMKLCLCLDGIQDLIHKVRSAAAPEDPIAPYNKMIVGKLFDIIFSRQLTLSVDRHRVCFIKLMVRHLADPIKYIVRGE